MRSLPAFVLGVLAAGSVFGSLSLVQAQGPARDASDDAPGRLSGDAGQVGRYGIAADNIRNIYVVDTQTGEVWSRSTADSTPWQSRGKPPANEAPARR